MQAIKRFLMLAAALLQAAPAAAAPAIHIAGDSTAATYGPSRYPQTGWGQMLRCAVRPGIMVRNHAAGGRSTRTFIEEGRLDAIARELRKGDALLIQFGHNDANTERPGRYAAPAGAYRVNLVRMIDVARSAGAQAVLITPVIRRHFVDGRVRADFAPWSEQVRRLAAERKVPLIDLEAESAALVQQAGEDASRRYYLHYQPQDNVPVFPKGIADDTHFSELGARAVAEIVARRLRALRLPVSRYILKRRPALGRATPLGSTSCD